MRAIASRDWLRAPRVSMPRVRMRLGLVASCLVFPLMAAAASGTPPALDVARASGPMHLTDHAEFLADPAGRWTVGELRSSAGGANDPPRFRPLTTAALSPGMTLASYWLRARLANSSDAPIAWALLAEAAYLDHVDAWIYDSDGNSRALQLTDRRAFDDRAISFRTLGLRHTTPPGGYTDVYLRVHYDRLDTMHLGFRLVHAESLSAFIAREYFGYGLLYGALLVLSVYALIVWRQARDPRFGLYAAYVFSTLLTWMAVNGHLHQFVLPNRPELVNQGMHVIFLMMVITALLFARTFLLTRQLLPRADRVLVGAVGVLTLAIVLRLAGLWAVPLLVAHGAVAMLVLLALLGIAAWRRGITYARWFVAAWLVYGGMLLLNALHVSGMLSWLHTGQIYPLAQGLNLLEIVMLAMAQADRMRLVQRDQQLAEQRYRELLESQNDVLERMVGERTHELATAWARAQEESETDEATGLGNRRFLLRAGEHALAEPNADRLQALAYFDLDLFKAINDEQGHAAGDAVLRSFAHALDAAVRTGDLTARFGGDEFVVLLTNLSNVDEARRVGERVCERFRAVPTYYEGRAIAHTVSAGIAVRPPTSRTGLRTLLARADVALYMAKQRGRDSVMIGDGGRESLDDTAAPG